MLKKLLLPAFLLLHFTTNAQTTSEDQTAVIATIQRMFDAMRAGDSTALRTTFDPSARLLTALTNKEGKPMLVSEPISKFVEAIGTPHKEVYDERIWSYDVRVGGRLATAWTDYTFYLDDKMLHCGVNAFHLFKGENGWKITQITDTRRKDGCQTEANPDLAAIHKLMDNWHHAAAAVAPDRVLLVAKVLVQLGLKDGSDVLLEKTLEKALELPLFLNCLKKSLGRMGCSTSFFVVRMS